MRSGGGINDAAPVSDYVPGMGVIPRLVGLKRGLPLQHLVARDASMSVQYRLSPSSMESLQVSSSCPRDLRSLFSHCPGTTVSPNSYLLRLGEVPVAPHFGHRLFAEICSSSRPVITLRSLSSILLPSCFLPSSAEHRPIS